MGRFRTLGRLLGPSDAAVNWAVRIYVLYTIGFSTVVSAVVGAVAWFAQNFVYGVWAFFGTWILVTVLQAVRVFTRSPPETAQAEPEAENAASQPAPADTDAHQAQEIERLTAALDESEQETEELRRQIGRQEGVIRKQQERLNRYDGNRLRLKELLQNALGKGTELRGSKPSESEAREWAQRVHDFIEDANARAAHHFMHVDPGGVSNDLDATPEQAYLDKRISRLTGLIQEVASDDAVPFRKGFDSHEWKDWKTPPQDSSGGQDDSQHRPGYWDNRQMLHAALKDFYADSVDLENEDAYEDDEVEQWENRTTQLIAESLGQEEASRFLTNEDQLSSGLADASARHAWLEHRRFRLRVLVAVVNSLSPLEIRPDFDGREWVGSEQFRFKQ